MTRTPPEWAYLTDHTGRYWYNFGNGSRLDPKNGKAVRISGDAIFGIPAHDFISISQWIHSRDQDVINEVVNSEFTKLGLQRMEGPGKVTAWQPLQSEESGTLVHSISTPWSIEELENPSISGDFTEFLPQYALYSAPGNAVVLWQENDLWVAGYTRGQKWVHIQTLSQVGAQSLLPEEIRLTLIELSARGLLAQVEQIVVWAPYDLELHQLLEKKLGINLRFEARPEPKFEIATGWGFVPHDVSRKRIARTRRYRAILLGIIGVVLLLIFASAALFHLRHLEQANERLQQKISVNREAADQIESAMNRWEILAPAIDPKRSPVELFHLISALLPEKGVRLTSFEVRDNKLIEIRAESSTMANAIQFKGALEKDTSLSDYAWVVPPPRASGDLTEILATGTYKFSQDSETE